jgi:serine/threonine-protein kinase
LKTQWSGLTSGPLRRLRQESDRLPPELSAAAARSIGALALTVAAVMAAIGAMDVVFIRAAGGAARWSAIAAGAAMSLALFAACRSPRVPAARLLDLGAAYQVGQGFLLALHHHALPQPAAGGALDGWSPLAVWILTCPLVVPATARRTVVAALATAAAEPLAHALVPSAAAWQSCARSVVIAVIVAPVASRIVYGLVLEVVRAREMGSYQLVERIGQGGMGEVWRAHHRLLARSSVIKLIRPELLGENGSRLAEEVRQRFEREARATAGLRSPHTIEVYDFGTTRDGTFYYVMEHLEGFSLDALVRRLGPLPPARVANVLAQACDSLAEAHLFGVIHRDVKPANLFLGPRGLEPDFVKVLDFGLAKPTSVADPHLTAAEAVIGTPAYMAPEQALSEGGAVDARTDIYALGCVGYWLLTGQVVFAGSAMQMMLDHIRTAPVPPSRRVPQPIPPALEKLILRCLEKDPALRPQSAAELREALLALDLGEPWTRARAAAWWAEHGAATAAADGAAEPDASREAARRREWAALATIASGN